MSGPRQAVLDLVRVESDGATASLVMRTGKASVFVLAGLDLDTARALAGQMREMIETVCAAGEVCARGDGARAMRTALVDVAREYAIDVRATALRLGQPENGHSIGTFLDTIADDMARTSAFRGDQ